MPASFLGLPAELRNEIYALLLVREEPIDPWCGSNKLTPNLLATNTTILHEAGSFLYGHNHFDFIACDLEAIHHFLHTIGFVNASHLRSIRIDLLGLCDLADALTNGNGILHMLETIKFRCTSLQTLIISAEFTYALKGLSGFHSSGLTSRSALALIDASLSAIPSLREIIAEVYEGRSSSDITMKMQSHGWIVNVVEDVQEAGWEIHRLPDEYEDDEYASDDYDADDYDIDNDSDFWGMAAD